MLWKLVTLVSGINWFMLSAEAAEPRGNNIIVTTVRNEDRTQEYIVTRVRRSEDPPWLFYATSREETPPGHSIGFSSAHDDVFVDDRRFSYIKGTVQILTKREGKLLVRRVKKGRYCSLRRIEDLDDLAFCDVKKILADVWRDGIEAEPSHATEPATESVPQNDSSPPAR